MEDTKKYKTRTFFRDENNGSISGVWLNAVDIGYSSVKVFSQNALAVFPSFARRFYGEFVGTLPDYHIVYKDLDTNETWLVGEAAQNDVEQGDMTISEGHLYSEDRYADPMFLVLVRTSLGLGTTGNIYGSPEGRTIHVQTGLPPKYMKRYKKDIIKAFSGRHRFSLRLGNGPERAYDLTVEKENVDVMEQPKGTLMSVAVDKFRRFVPSARGYFNQNVLIFDAGFGTLDIYPIRNNHVGEKQTFTEYSMRQVFRETINAISDKYDEEVSMVGIQKCLGDGYVTCHDRLSSREEEFGDLLEAASAKVCDAAIERFAQIYRLHEYKYLIVTGGTGAAWNDMIREKLKGLKTLTIVNGNQTDPSLPFLFANVRGYYMFMYTNMSRNAARKGEKI